MVIERSIFQTVVVYCFLLALIGVYNVAALGQKPGVTPPKTILLDADGRLLTDNQFVELRLANPHSKDPAKKTILADGSIEFRLQKVPQEGTVAPAFAMTTVDGQTVDAAGLKGKVVVLNFWYIGCPGCMDEIPKLNALAKKYAGSRDVMFISLALDSDRQLRAFREGHAFEYALIGQSQPVIELFSIKSFPCNIVIGRDGRIVYWRSVVRAWETFDAVIQAETQKK